MTIGIRASSTHGSAGLGTGAGGAPLGRTLDCVPKSSSSPSSRCSTRPTRRSEMRWSSSSSSSAP